MGQNKYIPINFWDDFGDDTFAYVEDTKIPQEKRKEYLEFLLDYINKNLNTEGIRLWIELYESKKKYPHLVGNPEAERMFFDRWEIKIEGLTHKRLNEWMEVLENVDIKVDGIPFHIYSES